jgi:hypothetical protein
VLEIFSFPSVALGDLCGGGQFFKEYLTTEYTECTEKGTRRLISYLSLCGPR